MSEKSFRASDLRILSGKFKGLRLKSPNLATTHPMGSREKLALFNQLSPYLDGAVVLDYFAGSGALGLEALSRGAASVTFVENNPKALQTIRENCKKLEKVWTGDAFSEVLSEPKRNSPLETSPTLYDLIISDPPYDNYEVPDYAKLLKKGGILALSHPGTFDPKTITGLTLLKTSHYAACHISLFTK